MNYPLISEYVQSIKLAEENLDKLSNLSPVLDADGAPVMSSGNFAVVFKMQDRQTGKFYAVKCFLCEQESRDESYKLIASELEYVSSTFLTPIKYLERELFVDTTQSSETEFPVLLMDWVEGLTLDKYIRNHLDDSYRLSLTAYQFCRMGAWLLSQEFAHGDLKPDNIIVKADGQLVLIDYDGMFVPAMHGRKARETGSADYRHPLRSEEVFNANIDDFSIASIALSLKAISLNPQLLGEFGADDRLLFSAKDYRNISDSECMKAVTRLTNDRELSQLLGLFYIAYARNELDYVSFKLLNMEKPEIELSTQVTEEDLADAVVDEYWITYSKDGLRLLKALDTIERYKVREGVRVICDDAFEWYSSLLSELVIPNSVISIGDNAFCNCKSLREVVIPDSVVSIGNGAFSNCTSLQELVIPDSVTSIGEGAFSNCTSLQELVIPDSVTSIGEGAFRGCTSLQELIIPDSVTSIGYSAFFGCTSLQELIIPDSVTSIGYSAFSYCRLLQELVVPDSVTSIGDCAFSNCTSLQELVIPDSVTSIGDFAFSNCTSLQELVIPDSVTSIGEGAFRGCTSLQELIIPDSATCIGDNAFCNCESLREVVIPDSVTSIGDCVFSDCESLHKVLIPDSVTSIGYRAFSDCTSLQELVIPDSVTSIGDNAFCNCESLREVVIPDSVTSIGDCAFSNCTSLQELVIPDSVTSIGDFVFSHCKSLYKVLILDSVKNIGHNMFYGCRSLASIIVPKKQTQRFRELLKNSGCKLSAIKKQDE